MSNPKYFNIIIKPRLERVHMEFLMMEFLGRDHDMSELDDPHIIELMRKGTIPPSLSLRAPPTHIGTSHHRIDVLGITKEEISKKYIIKLQRDRERNNEAVYKSLDNLPIKIRQVARNSFEKSQKSSPSSFKSREKDLVQSESLAETYNQSNQYVKPIEATGNKNKGMNGRKQKTKLKVIPKENNFEFDNTKGEDESQRVPFDPKSLNMLHSEMPYIFSSGFQGYQNRLKLSRRKPLGFGQSVNTVSREQDFQKRYQRVLDSNQQPHFVKTSLVKGQRVNSNYMKIKSVINNAETERSEDIFAIHTVQRINEPFLFTSPASPTRVPNPSLYSECQGSEHSLNVNGIAASPRPRTGSSTNGEVDSCKNSFQGDEDNELTQRTKIKGEPNDTGKKEQCSDDSDNQIPKLSLELLRVHENATSAQSKKGNNACNLTDITEREESNLTKTTRSEVVPDMKISVRINYKSKEDAIEENMSNASISSRKSKDSKSSLQLQHSYSNVSRGSASTLSETPLETLRIDGRLCGEKSNAEKKAKTEVVCNIDTELEKDNTNPEFEDNEVQQIIVDLNRLKTVKTPNRQTKPNENQTKLDKKTLCDSDQTEFIPASTDQKADFFLTYNDGDSDASDCNDSASLKHEDSANLKPVKDTPRTEIDDSGISISTLENDAIKC